MSKSTRMLSKALGLQWVRGHSSDDEQVLEIQPFASSNWIHFAEQPFFAAIWFAPINQLSAPTFYIGKQLTKSCCWLADGCRWSHAKNRMMLLWSRVSTSGVCVRAMPKPSSVSTAPQLRFSRFPWGNGFRLLRSNKATSEQTASGTNWPKYLGIWNLFGIDVPFFSAEVSVTFVQVKTRSFFLPPSVLHCSCPEKMWPLLGVSQPVGSSSVRRRPAPGVARFEMPVVLWGQLYQLGTQPGSWSPPRARPAPAINFTPRCIEMHPKPRSAEISREAS